MDPTRFTVPSADGTLLDVQIRGAGEPLLLVHGSTFDRGILDPLVTEIEGRLTTFALNRRGFRPSGDTPVYAIEREFEDVAAVVAAVADRTGRPVSVFGHSYGANCAMGGAARAPEVHRLVLYEPSLGMPALPGWIEAAETALAAGRPEDVLRSFFEAFGATEADFAAFREGPQWADCLAAAPTILRETRVEDAWRYGPGVMDGLTAPILMLIGTETLPALMRSSLLALAHLPSARVHVLTGHGHDAIDKDPAMLAGIVSGFLRETESALI